MQSVTGMDKHSPAPLRRSRAPGTGLVQVLVAVGALMLATGPRHASALPSGFGSSCSLTGGTGASAGSGESPINNTATLSGSCGTKDTASSGQFRVAVETDAGPSVFSFNQNATTSAGARASLGSLGAFSSSTAMSSPAAYLYLSNGVGAITENEYAAGASSTATASWYDLLTIGGTANANGFVVLRFTLELHGQTIVSPPGPSASASIESRLFIDDFSRFNGSLIDLTEPGSASQTVGFRQGQQVQLYGDLNVTSNAFAGRRYSTVCSGFVCFPVRGGYFPDSNAVADASNTAGFSVDVVTPGGSYTSMSGQSYVTVATAVPEPSTWALLTAGLLATASLGRRQVARRRSQVALPLPAASG